LRKAPTVTTTLILVILALCLFPASMGQEKTNVIIISDGSVTPSTAPIQQKGDVYKLTNGYEGEVLILRNNIVFDGQKILSKALTMSNLASNWIEYQMLQFGTWLLGAPYLAACMA
jgi:hypothetical protein